MLAITSSTSKISFASFITSFLSSSFCQERLTNVGFTTGSHGWGISVQKLFRLNEKSFWGIDGRFYSITGLGDMPSSNYNQFGIQERNQKSLLMLPVSVGIQHYPLQGKIANNFFPFRSNRLITKINAATLPPDFSINLAAASAVPPVAIRSSTITTSSPFSTESL